MRLYEALTAPASAILAGNVGCPAELERELVALDVVIVNGTSPITDPCGLLASFESERNVVVKPLLPPKHGNPRPYLKRKKGRS